ncbi:hypothetical protein [Luteipulveratus flavus]|uniref:Integral membrane protein n=1 Tax=Luteipulveratus flavus TaxID=3031728 RepID=A0ABT6C4Z6_9MICO|nr:hypothetical protein [Luteipulveratus sp. YIM 133296]MDF8263124.1 hypothetical protein [Luteipulveratus sp. YIM 133296]
MDLVYNVVVIAHLLGMAALVGGWFAVMKAPRPTALMVWGARAQIVTGLILVGLAEGVDSLDKDPDHAKIGLKLLVALAAVAFAEIARGRSRRAGGDQVGLVSAAGWLGVLNVVIAAGWN